MVGLSSQIGGAQDIEGAVLSGAAAAESVAKYLQRAQAAPAAAASGAAEGGAAHLRRLRVPGAIVEMDGDEMSRVMSALVGPY